jgi:uroporphyrin-III C-methyltransferase
VRRGTVALVGAGPGDPGLLTVRGLARLRAADLVVYDRLVDPRLLAEARHARRVFAGKAPGRHALAQAEINALLIRHARRGRRVVRLKGGDPFVFGRGGEEVEALAAAGVPCEVVPGVTSAVAAPAAAGIPLTRRGVAASFAVATGHACGEGRAPDWARLATATDTLVLLMALGELPRIADRLVAHGRPPSTPVAIVSGATTARQATLVGRLDDIAARAAAARVSPPAVVVVGEVVRLGYPGAPHALVVRAPRAEPFRLPALLRRPARRPRRHLDTERRAGVARAVAHGLAVPSGPDLDAPVRAAAALLPRHGGARRPGPEA